MAKEPTVGEYEVEKILSRKVVQGRICYLVKWLGYSSNENTWEPVEHLYRCVDLVEKFETEYSKGNSRKAKREKSPKAKKQALGKSLREKQSVGAERNCAAEDRSADSYESSKNNNAKLNEKSVAELSGDQEDKIMLTSSQRSAPGLGKKTIAGSGRFGVATANSSSTNVFKFSEDEISEINTDNNEAEEMIEDADSVEPNLAITEDKPTETSGEVIMPARIIGVAKAGDKCKYVVELPRREKEMAVFETFSTTEIAQMWPRLAIEYLEERISLY